MTYSRRARCTKTVTQKLFSLKRELVLFEEGKCYQVTDDDGNYVIGEDGYKKRFGKSFYSYFKLS